MAVDLCLQLAKYSHVDNLETSGKDKWTHITHHDMFVLLKGNESTGSMIMTIIAGNSKLETIDIGIYVDHALSARRAAESRGLDSVRTDQLPIFCITKDAALALRYRLFDNGVTRRIQLKLQSASDCRQLLTLLQRRGIEVQDRPGTARPNTSNARPQTSNAEFRPLTTQSTSSYFDPDYVGRQGSPQHRPQAPTSEPMRPPIKAPPTYEEEDLYGLSPRRTAYAKAPECDEQIHGRQSIPAESHPRGHQASPSLDAGCRAVRVHMNDQDHQNAPSQDPGVRRFVSRDYSIAPQEAVPSIPSNAQLWRSHTTNPTSVSTYQPHQVTTELRAERYSSASNMVNLDAIRLTSEERETSSKEGGDSRPPDAIAGQEQSSSGATYGPGDPYTSSGPPEHRPQTAASGTSLTLPDPRAPSIVHQKEDVSRRPMTSSSSSRPGSSALELPPLKRPKLVKEMPAPFVHDLYSQPTHIRPRSAKAHERPVPPAASHTSVSRRDEYQPSARETAPDPKLLDPPRIHTSYRPEQRHSPVKVVSGIPRPLTERSNNAGLLRLTSNTDAPHEIESPPPSADPNSRPALPPAFAKDDALGRASMAIQPLGDLSLERYAAQSRSDREATLADFMIENLENPAFTTLCEDVENCWQRIALGL